MNSVVFHLVIALIAGLSLGGIFFGGLWWTVQKGLTSPHPACWFFGSTMARTALVLIGFYLIGDHDWTRLLLCLLGFVLGRVLVTRLTRLKEIDAPQQ